MINENALSNILVDVDFLEEEFKRNGRGHLNSAFNELRTVRRLGFPSAIELTWAFRW